MLFSKNSMTMNTWGRQNLNSTQSSKEKKQKMMNSAKKTMIISSLITTERKQVNLENFLLKMVSTFFSSKKLNSWAAAIFAEKNLS